MKHVTLLEYGRIYVVPDDDDRGTGLCVEDGKHYIERRYFERLRQFDEKHSKNKEGQQIFSFTTKYMKAKQWVGVIQAAGICVEILPKCCPKVEVIKAKQQSEYEKRLKELSEIVDGENGPFTDEHQRLKEEMNALNSDSSIEKKMVEACKSNLLYMLALGKSPKFRERDLASLDTRKAPLNETLVLIFARRLQEELLKGMSHNYVKQEENLNTLKGKLQFSRHILKNAANQARFYCEYEAFLPDNLMNRIFKSACRLLLDHTGKPRTQEKLRHCLMILDEVSDVFITLDDFDKVVLNRQNQRFHEVFNFCMLVLSQQSPTAGKGQHHTFTLLFDMNAVYEEFITAVYKKKVLHDENMQDWELCAQGKEKLRRYLLRTSYIHGQEAKQDKHVLLKPDLAFKKTLQSSVGEKSEEYLIIDTKWKCPTFTKGSPVVDRSDFYQMFAYSQRYDAVRNILLFPKPVSENLTSELFIYNYLEDSMTASADDLNSPGAYQVELRFIDFNKDLRKDKEDPDDGQEQEEKHRESLVVELEEILLDKKKLQAASEKLTYLALYADVNLYFPLGLNLERSGGQLKVSEWPSFTSSETKGTMAIARYFLELYESRHEPEKKDEWKTVEKTIDSKRFGNDICPWVFYEGVIADVSSCSLSLLSRSGEDCETTITLEPGLFRKYFAYFNNNDSFSALMKIFEDTDKGERCFRGIQNVRLKPPGTKN